MHKGVDNLKCSVIDAFNKGAVIGALNKGAEFSAVQCIWCLPLADYNFTN